MRLFGNHQQVAGAADGEVGFRHDGGVPVEGVYPTDFLRSSDWKCLPDNHEIYRKLIEKVSFIDYLSFLVSWD